MPTITPHHKPKQRHFSSSTTVSSKDGTITKTNLSRAEERVLLTLPTEPWPPPYVIDTENGLRRLKPYHYTYHTYCKERWRGRELIDIFASEFRDRTLEYYRHAIDIGKLTINGAKTTPNTLVRNGDIVSHKLHRHEPPVTSESVAVIHEDEDIIVISKPAGVPVHPAGRYHYNSVCQIMRAERGFEWVPMPCNRLDRLTSGIMFLGKSKKAAEVIGEQIRSRTVKKEYIARVIGEFPADETVCEQPILQISPKLGLNRVRANGKEARTVFRRLAYYPMDGSNDFDEDDGGGSKPGGGVIDGTNGGKGLPWKKKTGYSIVRCMPETGRTHQLRVHLQFLGHPISNDPIYCNQKVFGQDLAQGDGDGDRDEDIMSRLAKMGKEEVADAVAYHDEMVDEHNKRKAEKMTGKFCEECHTALYSDPGQHELGIYLHARRYACEDGSWEYETPLPKWALPPDGAEGPREADAATDPLAKSLGKLEIERNVGEEIPATAASAAAA